MTDPTPNPTPLAEHSVITRANALCSRPFISVAEVQESAQLFNQIRYALLRAVEGLEGIKAKCTATDDPSTAFLYEALAPVFTEISECVDADLVDIRSILDGEVQQNDKP